jgi:hypothetical protein
MSPEVSSLMRSLESSAASLPGWAARLLERLAQDRRTPLDSFRLDPGAILRLAGLQLDPWQLRVLSSDAPRIALLCSRQVGKSTAAAALALRTAVLEAPALVLITSPSERQSGEFMVKVKGFYAALRRPRKLAGTVRKASRIDAEEAGLDEAWLALPQRARESALQLHLKNGSRIIGLPASPATILGYSGVSLLVVDEAARVPDDLYRTCRPMLATSRGRLLALTTPFGKRGWFFEAWASGAAWERISVRAADCPRIPADFLAEERQALGPRWFRQEYECSFEDATSALFAYEDLVAAIDPGVKPFPLPG